MAESDFAGAKFIWVNGKFSGWEKAKFHVLSHALLYGTGVFEGIRCYATPDGPALFRLKDHIERLFYSAGVMKMKKALKFSPEEIEEACIGVAAKNKLQECYLRPILFYGYGKIGLSQIGVPVEAAVAAWPQKDYLGKGAAENGIRIKASSIPRVFPNKELANAKITGNYVASMLAKTEAIEAGFDEALMLDKDGFVAECAVENIFIVSNGNLITPPAQNALGGITRKSVIEIAAGDGIAAEEKFFRLDELCCADEAFITGTSAEVTPVVQVDSKKIGNGKPGKTTKTLQEKFLDAVHGKSKKRMKWLTPI